MASVEMKYQSSMGNSSLASFTAFVIYLSFTPLKGGYPQSIMYMITPTDHTSHFSLYFPSRTSGAM